MNVIRQSRRYRSIKEVCEEFGVCRSTVYKWIKSGLLPQPIQITKRCVRFLTSDLEVFCQKWDLKDSGER